PAAQVSRSFTIDKADQAIIFPQPASPQPLGASFAVGATTSSGLPVTFAASGGCTIIGSTVTVISSTTACTLTASQEGDGNYKAADSVMRTVSPNRADQSIGFSALAGRTFGDAD